jgi:hypothetical protein
MRIADSILNKSEELAFRELKSIADDNGLRLFAKTRLSDVITKDHRHRLVQSEFDFYTKAHVDFVITNTALKPIMVVEYDGPFHNHATK